MTKKLLQGIATGIFLTTTIFAYNFYFTDNFHVVKEANSDENSDFSNNDLHEYLEKNDLITLQKNEYEEMLTQLENSHLEQNIEKPKEQNDEITKEKTIKEIVFVIDPGTSSGQVGVQLENKGLIDDRKKFETYLTKQGLETKIKAGNYQLSTDMSLEEIVEKLT